MPDEYIDAPIEFDEVTLYQRGITRIQEYYPNWTPKPASMIDILLRTCGEMAAVGAEVASDVPFSIFRAFGPLAHVPPIDATAATAVATFTAQDANGYDIPQGTPVGLIVSGVTMDPVGFETAADAVIPVGSMTVNATIVATIPGANTTGLNSVVRADSLGYITTITLQGATVGGNDAELDPDFVNRLSSDFETWTTTPIRGPDFARKARDIIGVYRCAYWENYNPADGTTTNDKYVALCPIDINGNAVSAGVQTQVANYIQGLREVNFVAPVVSPSYSPIDVTAVLHVSDASLEAQAISDANGALQAFLFAGNWGAPQTGVGQAPVWNNTPAVRLSRVVTVLENVNNVNYADGVLIGFSAEVPPTPVPTTANAGGTIAAGAYEVAVSYVEASGEENISAVATIVTTGTTSTITIPSPPANGDATGWYAYVSQVGGSTLTRQQVAGSPTAIGTALTLAASPTNTGAAPLTANPDMGTADLIMPGSFPLPQVGILKITATAP